MIIIIPNPSLSLTHKIILFVENFLNMHCSTLHHCHRKFVYNIIANWIGRIKKEKELETYDMYIDLEVGDNNTVVCMSVEMRLGFSFVMLEASPLLSVSNRPNREKSEKTKIDAFRMCL